MEIKKWTDKELQTAFEDGYKFIDIDDLKDFLLKRRNLADTWDSNCNLQNGLRVNLKLKSKKN